MRYSYQAPDQRKVYGQQEAEIARAATAAMGDAARGMKDELRELTRAAGLGSRLAFTWQGKSFPAGRDSLDPAAYVWSKAPRIMVAFTQGVTIVPVNGQRYLAIPTENVPRKGRGRAMTPLDVEVAFNQDLIIRRGRRSLLAFVDVAAARYSKSQGAAYGKRKQARVGKPKLVLMFVLVRSVRLNRRLDLPDVGRRWGAKVPDLLLSHLR